MNMSNFYVIGMHMRKFALDKNDLRVFAECALALESDEETKKQRNGKEASTQVLLCIVRP